MGIAPLPNLRPDSEFTAEPSPYPNFALGLLAGDVTSGEFVRAHAVMAGEFSLVPSLPITLLKSTIDGKPVLELTDNDAEEIFRFVVVIKFWGVRPPLEVVHADVSKNWVSRFIIDLCDQKTLLIQFKLESNMLMALSS